MCLGNLAPNVKTFRFKPLVLIWNNNFCPYFYKVSEYNFLQHQKQYSNTRTRKNTSKPGDAPVGSYRAKCIHKKCNIIEEVSKENKKIGAYSLWTNMISPC